MSDSWRHQKHHVEQNQADHTDYVMMMWQSSKLGSSICWLVDSVTMLYLALFSEDVDSIIQPLHQTRMLEVNTGTQHRTYGERHAEKASVSSVQRHARQRKMKILDEREGNEN